MWDSFKVATFACHWYRASACAFTNTAANCTLGAPHRYSFRVVYGLPDEQAYSLHACWPCALTRRRFRVFLVRLLSGSARVSPSGFGEYRPRRLTQLTRQCRCAPSKSLSSNQQEKERSTPHFVCGPTGIRNCSTRASTVLHARALSCWPPCSPGCHAYFPTRLTSERAFST